MDRNGLADVVALPGTYTPKQTACRQLQHNVKHVNWLHPFLQEHFAVPSGFERTCNFESQSWMDRWDGSDGWHKAQTNKVCARSKSWGAFAYFCDGRSIPVNETFYNFRAKKLAYNIFPYENIDPGYMWLDALKCRNREDSSTFGTTFRYVLSVGVVLFLPLHFSCNRRWTAICYHETQSFAGMPGEPTSSHERPFETCYNTPSGKKESFVFKTSSSLGFAAYLATRLCNDYGKTSAEDVCLFKVFCLPSGKYTQRSCTNGKDRFGVIWNIVTLCKASKQPL